MAAEEAASKVGASHDPEAISRLNEYCKKNKITAEYIQRRGVGHVFTVVLDAVEVIRSRGTGAD